MTVRKFKPATPGQKHKIIGTFGEVTASVPEKSFVYSKKSSGGHNSEGKMTMRYMGGGHRKVIRTVDFRRNKDGIPIVIKTVEYNSNCSAHTALLFYVNNEKKYIITPNGSQVGVTLISGKSAASETGNALPLQNIPVDVVIHNTELCPGQGTALARSVGDFAQLTPKEGKHCVARLSSGEVRQILSTCKATIGSVGNLDHESESSDKAGRSRWQGCRPRNRGVIINPIDHPIGGDEGRASGDHPRSRRGLYAKGLRIRAPKKQSSEYIIKRRKR